MRKMSSPPVVAQGDIRDNVASFGRHLKAENLSPRTIDTYMESAHQLAGFLAEKGMPQDVANIRREHVEAFIADLLERRKPATAHNRFRGLQSFFKWLVEEGEIKDSPMAKMKPPRVAVNPPPVLREEELKRLVAVCEKDPTLEGRRDAAIIRVFADVGPRRAEVAGLRYCPGDDENNDVDLDRGLLRLRGKGGYQRVVSIGAKTVRAIDRYLKRRSQHPAASTPWLWLGHKGRFGGTGIFQMVRKRGRQAGLGDIHPHQLRHSFAHDWLAEGGAEGDLMQIAGWRSRTMLQRYAASTAAERAQKAQRKISLSNRL